MNAIFILGLALLSPLPSLANDSDSASLDELAQMELSMSGEKLCELYVKPVDSMNFPKRPFLIHPKKFYARVKGAQDYDSWMIRYRLNAEATLRETLMLQGWLQKTAAELHLSPASQVKLEIIDQNQFCADEAEAKLGDLLAKQKDQDRRKAIEAAMLEIKNKCLRKSIGAASFILSKIYFGSSILEKPIAEETKKTALLHELCHLVYPGIAGQAAEEIFCDSMALRWSSHIFNQTVLGKVRAEYANLLIENNPNEDLLLLRGKLATSCQSEAQ